ncbi:ThiF family adenylyltransferase [uncultured Lacinutrix sp.]|uniref:ThiF family adenylyltransferase n=1 Tax=uncultured Lacinutrix sp. TaxID=574032 RepID=UPI002604C80B|nr:ThiF family adenylyltransferase [uncultured Lacinutrix sp.]
MRVSRKNIITKCIEGLSFVNLVSSFEQVDIFLKGKIEIAFDGLDTPLLFTVEILPQYPFKSYNEETIKFINQDLLAYKHVMGNGTICIHTSHSIHLKEKLNIDFNSLKNWIVKYYINKEEDNHYEHLIVPQHCFKNNKYTFTFTNVDYEFKKHDYGFVNLKFLNNGVLGDMSVTNFLTDSFVNSSGKELASCKWSLFYKSNPQKYHGIYIFVESPPAFHDRFVLLNWENFVDVFKLDFLKFLHHCEKDYINKKLKGQVIPLYIGYNIPNSEIHWQVALLEVGKFPIEGVKEHKKWITELTHGQITWAISHNVSYSYFFGRGAFSENITKKKILIIGIGAIGSIVARTLVKSGSLKIDLCDYDIKEPENVCRAEFQFANGLTDKVDELKSLLSLTSPFVEVRSVNQIYFESISKALFNDPNARKELEEFINSYDTIFDCTTDNDLMHVINQLKLSCDVINLSITNKAQELVCAFYPNIYGFVTHQFEKVLKQDTEDMYNPTGCWSPTFKASYNDINLLVQYALKHINLLYQKDLPKNNFVIETGSEIAFKLKLKEF